MMKVTKLAALLCLQLLAVPIFAAGVLSNSGFESDPVGQTNAINGWTGYGYYPFSETGPQAHSGTNYFKIYQEFTGAVNYSGIFQDYISAPGVVYAADGWAYSASTDVLQGQNAAWIEITFRDAYGNILSLYRSLTITQALIASGGFPTNTWTDLAVTNQYDPNSYVITNTTAKLTAPAGTFFVRYQIVFEGDANKSGGSMYFDDLNLNPLANLPYGNMNIVWSDEFNGSAVNTNIWTYDLGNGGSNPGWGNNELEYYTSNTNNALETNGSLHIIARQQSTNGFNYTSARLKSLGLFSWLYGRMEWRAQLPQGSGTWPALWMMGANIESVPWPGCGEIDVMENAGSNPFYVQGSLHSGSDETGIYNFTDGNAVTNFHLYTLDWTTNAFLYYVDGHLYETQTGWSSSTGNAYPFPFNQPFFILMNMAIGGSYVNNPTTNVINAGTTFPSQMVIDYVRIYNPTLPLNLAMTRSGSNIVLSWPSGIVCHLQSQSDPLGRGISTNWVNMTTITNSLQITPSAGSSYYRLVSP